MFKMIFLALFSITLLNANSSFNKGMKFFIKGKHEKALPHFIDASNQGSKAAQFYLGNMFEKGLGVPKNKEMSKKLYMYSTGNKKVKTNLSVNSVKKLPNTTKKKYQAKTESISTVSSEFKKSSNKKKKQTAQTSKSNSKDLKKAYSKKMKKHYIPALQGAEEIVFD